jgi:hypothetical protein
MHNLQQQLLHEHFILSNYLCRGDWAVVPAHDWGDLRAAEIENNCFGSKAEALAELKEVAEIYGTTIEYWTVVEGRAEAE